MTNMAILLKLFPNKNCYIQDISVEPGDVDKVFSISRCKRNLPFEIDFEMLAQNGFKPIRLDSYENKDELIVKFTEE